MDNKELEMAKEVEVASLYTELNITAATRLVLEQYKKAHYSTDQSKSYEHIKTFKDIIPLESDIDNGDIYNLETTLTIRRIEDESI